MRLSLFFSTLILAIFLPSCDRNDHQPEISDQVFYLDENSKAGTFVGKVEARDLDEQQSLSFEIIEGNSANTFTLDEKSGNLLVNNPAALDFEQIQKIELQVLVSDNHPDDPKESSARITVFLINLNEYAPVIEEQSFSVNENSPTGTFIGKIVATDPDSGQSLSFRIESGNGDQAVQLDSLSGELTVKDATWFNYNLHQELTCMVSVCDNDNVKPFRSYALITIEVVDVASITIDVSGYVQKGPFILGSSITISELNNDLQPTGRVFSTQISDNTGKYNLPSVELASPYILLKADGFYFNERNGELSEAQLTLHSLVDITDMESFNINVISHLEKDRIIELMKGGMEFNEAKLQSKNEILGIFGFVSVDQLQSEEMDIAHTGEDNAMLLAASLILQGFRTTGEFSEIMSQIILDFKEDGTLDNPSIGSELINGINTANLQNIRQFIEQRYDGFGITYEIPDFEKYINQFITQTSFVATNQLVFPAYGTYGLNVLCTDVTQVEHHNLNDIYYSLAVEVPEGRSFMVKIIGGCLYAHGSLINMSNYFESEPIRFSTYSTTSSGLCDVKVEFLYNTEIPANNIKVLEYYADDNPEPFFIKEVEVMNDNVPIDSTLFK
jgi:hypothetical protein